MSVIYFIQGYLPKPGPGHVQTDFKDKIKAIKTCLKWRREGVKAVQIHKSTLEDITHELDAL